MDFEKDLTIVLQHADNTTINKIETLIKLGIGGGLGNIFENIENRRNSEKLWLIRNRIIDPLRDYVYNLKDLSSLIFYSKKLIGENTAIDAEIVKIKQGMVQKLDEITNPIRVEFSILEKIIKSEIINESVKNILLEHYFPRMKQYFEYTIDFIRKYLEGAV